MEKILWHILCEILSTPLLGALRLGIEGRGAGATGNGCGGGLVSGLERCCAGLLPAGPPALVCCLLDHLVAWTRMGGSGLELRALDRNGSQEAAGRMGDER